MEIVYKKVSDLIPYENNPRINDEAVNYVANSIKTFGFKVPIIIDKNNVIIAGHTRLKASEQLGLKEVPCIVADDLNEEQVNAFRLADNKVSEFSMWDYDLLDEELGKLLDLNMEDFGFKNLDEGISYIDDLLNEEFVNTSRSNEFFDITFTFQNKYKEEVNDYIKENGKEAIVEQIIKMIEGE